MVNTLEYYDMATNAAEFFYGAKAVYIFCSGTEALPEQPVVFVSPSQTRGSVEDDLDGVERSQQAPGVRLRRHRIPPRRSPSL